MESRVAKPVCFAFSGSGGGGGPSSAGAPLKSDRRGGKKAPGRKFGGSDNTEDKRNARRNSLRIGTGRKGNRGGGNRRGSLKKRDRTAEKEARAEAALERNTVQIPE